MRTRASIDIPRGSNAHEDQGAFLCSLYSLLYPLLINQKAKRRNPPHIRTLALPDVDVSVYFTFLEVFMLILEKTDLYL